MTDTQWSDALLDEELAALYMSPATFKEISAGADLLTDLGLEETKFLFEAALQHGEYLHYWFNRLQAAGGEAASWTIIEEKIANEAARFEQAENAVRLLGEINDAKALEYLKKALQQDALAATAVRVLSTMRTKESLAVLKEELRNERLADLVIDSLSQLRSREAVDLIGLALRQKILAPHPEMALNRISKSRTHPSAKQAAEILDVWQREQKKATETRALEYPDVTRGGDAGLKDRDWEIIIRRIRDGKCTPLLGPDSSSKYFPSLATIAQDWASKYNYPFENYKDFPSVSEFVSVQMDALYPPSLLEKAYQQVEQSDPGDPTNSVALLADLPLSVYITTTYDDMLFRALQHRHRNPVREVCRWNKYFDQSSAFDQGFSPSASNPMVFHLFGHVGIPESLVLTTRDYFSFLINVSKDISLIPPRIQKALSGSAILFLGFGFREFSARVLFSIVNDFLEISVSKTHVAVLRPSDNLPENQQARAGDYLDRYFKAGDIRIYRRTVEEFCEELRQRWQASEFL